MGEIHDRWAAYKAARSGGGGSVKPSTSKVARVSAGLFIAIPVEAGEFTIIDWGPGSITKGSSVYGMSQSDLDVSLVEGDSHYVVLPDLDAFYDVAVHLQVNCDDADAGKAVTAVYQGNGATKRCQAVIGAESTRLAVFDFDVQDWTWADGGDQGFALIVNGLSLTVAASIASATATITKR